MFFFSDDPANDFAHWDNTLNHRQKMRLEEGLTQICDICDEEFELVSDETICPRCRRRIGMDDYD